MQKTEFQMEAEQDVQIQPTQCSPEGFFSDDSDQNCSVKVAVRVRPMVGRELREGNQKSCIQTSSSGLSLQIGEKDFTFDRVFHQQEKQADIFDVCARNLILGCFSGYNATILAYGQTGSGKTHTMGTGSTVGLSLEQIGIVPRVFDFIFEELQKRQQQSEFSEFTVKIQFLELYGEDIHDLFDAGSIDKSTGQSNKPIQIREEKNGTISVVGLKQEVVTNRTDCLKLLNQGISHRVTSATLMNEGSSRSHAIFTITIEQKIVKTIPSENEAEEPVAAEEFISAKFHFVDLAGSERIKKTGATGKLMQEGISINKGLLMLGNVISALTDEKKSSGGFIPYRDSKLTRILQDSLGGNSRTTMIACVSPADSNYDESTSAIKYASRARNIKNKPIVNRDANSMLIEALRAQISTLQASVGEYQNLLKANHIEVPANFASRVQERDPPVIQRSGSAASESMVQASSGEMRELKMKLAKKERDFKEVVALMEQLKEANSAEKENSATIERERDELALKQEAILEHMTKNNVAPPPSLVAASKDKKTTSLLDDYKGKIAKFKEEIEKKNADLLASKKKISELEAKLKRDEHVLKKAVEEVAKSKRTRGSSFSSPSKQRPQQIQSEKTESMPDIGDFKELQNQFVDKLTQQLESMFQDSESDNTSASSELHLEKASEEDVSSTSVAEASRATSLEDKEKVLDAVRKNVEQIKNDLGELLKDTWGKKIAEIERAKQTVEKERTRKVADISSGGAQADSKQLQALDREYKAKMDELNRALESQQRDKRRKEEQVTKTMQQQEARLKSMEAEIAKMKKEKAELESQKKFGEERFSKLKVSVKQEQVVVKKTVAEKEKTVAKLKLDLKKTDELVQAKISELKGLQKKARDDFLQRQKEEDMVNQSQGIDVDSIKDWINLNTEQLLKQQDLKEYLNKQIKQREEIEDEMLDEGDRLTELMIEKERMELEMLDLDDEEDEGRRMELEAELEDIVIESESITQVLDTLDEHLEYVRVKCNQLTEQIQSFDMDSVQAPRFKGLNSVEAAKVTLRTFFMVLLDLNVYKRDLEAKCIEQDETILDMQSNLALLQSRGGDLTAAEKQTLIRKDRAISQLMNAIGESTEFVDNRDLASMQLTAQEQGELTKMSLSKIVSNLRNKLKDEEKKAHCLALKLDQLGKEKEQLREKLNNVTKQQKKTTSTTTARQVQLSRVKSRINTGLAPMEKSIEAKKKPPVPRFDPAEPQKQQNVTQERRLSFKARRQMMKQTHGGSLDIEKTQQSVDSLTSQPSQPSQYTSLKDRRAQSKQSDQNKGKSAKELTDELAEIEHQFKTTPKPSGNRPRRDYPKQLDSDLLTSASQPETVEECDEEQEIDEAMLIQMNEERLDKLLAEEDKEEDKSEDSEEVKTTNKWFYEAVTNFEYGSGSTLVEVAVDAEKVYALFSDFSLKEISVLTKAVTSERNLKELFPQLADSQTVVTMDLNSEVQMLALSDSKRVHVFNLEDEFSYLMTMEVPNVTYIAFMDCYIMLLQESDDSDESVLQCYMINETEPEGVITIKTFLSQKLSLRTSVQAQAVFFTTGTLIGRISVPEMQLMFQEESEHKKPIIDFAVANTFLCTTSQDGNVHVFDSETGMMLIAPVEDMECDSLCVLGIHIVARCGKGAATFFFTYVDGMEDLEEDSCIEHSADEMPEEGDLYLMKSGIIAGNNLEDAVLCIRASPAIEESGNVELLLLRRREL